MLTSTDLGGAPLRFHACMRPKFAKLICLVIEPMEPMEIYFNIIAIVIVTHPPFHLGGMK